MAERTEGLSSLLDQVKAAVIATDLEGTVTLWNRHAEVLYGWLASEAVGRSIHELIVPVDEADLADSIMREVSDGASWQGEFPVRRKDGAVGIISVADAPLYDEHDQLIGIVGVSMDITHRKEVEKRRRKAISGASKKAAAETVLLAAELAAERTVRLQAITAALAEADSLDEVVAVILEHVESGLGATAGVVAILTNDGRELKVLDSFGYRRETIERFTTFPVDAPLPLSDVVRSGRPLLLSKASEIEERYPALAGLQPKNETFAAFPLGVKDRTVGGIGFSYPESRIFTDADTAFMRAVVQQCAQALDRISLYEKEREARRKAQEAEERLRFLADATRILSSSLDHRETLTLIAELAVPRLADWCAIEVADEVGVTRQLAVEHADPAKKALTLELRSRYPTDPDAEVGVPHVIRTGQPELYHEIDDATLRAAARDEEHLQLLRSLGFRSAMVVPMLARGRTIGALTLVSERADRLYDEDDLAFAVDLADRAALAVDNARLYEERTYVARSLQKALLPPRIVEIPGIDVATRYRPAAEGGDVGGDFYDVNKDGSGSWGIAIGDVQGKGAAAAALTGLARHILRAAAMHDPAPSHALQALNEVMLQEGAERFCTAAYARLIPIDSGVSISVASAGHPPPYVLRADGPLESFGEPGIILGCFEDLQLDERTTALASGDAVIFYTDGVIDDRPGGGIGVSRFEQLLGGCHLLDVESIAQVIEDEIVEGRKGSRTDDVALLVIKVR